MAFYPQIFNAFGERLDSVIEGKEDASSTIIFVHGFATDKHETNRYFDDLAFYLGQKFRIIRFDFSGCGKSEGRLEEKDYEKWKGDLKSVISFVKSKYQGDVYILAQSMGCFITSMLAPVGIAKTVFTGIPNNNVNYLIDRLVERFGSKPGSRIDFENISIFPRSNGSIQKIGPTFWTVLRILKPAVAVQKFSANTKLLIIHPDRDEIVGNVYLAQYSNIPGVTVKKLHGDHSFNNQEDRKALIAEIGMYFSGNGQEQTSQSNSTSAQNLPRS